MRNIAYWQARNNRQRTANLFLVYAYAAIVAFCGSIAYAFLVR